MDSEDNNKLTCRICLEECERKDLIAPCSCRGTSKWVHRYCLNQWRSTREDRAFSKCTECLCDYVLVSRHADSELARRSRALRYACLVARDLSLALAGTQLVIWLLAVFTWSIDSKSASLLKAFHFSSSPLLFYWLFGTFLFLALVGILFVVMQMGGSLTAPDCGCSHCSYMPLYLPGDCCVGCDCGAITAMECSAECAPFALVFLALCAVLGVFVAAFSGAAFIAQTTTRHLSVLCKQGLAADFIVQDLADTDATNLDQEEGSGVELRHFPSSYRVISNPVLDGSSSSDSLRERNVSDVSAYDRRLLASLGLL